MDAPTLKRVVLKRDKKAFSTAKDKRKPGGKVSLVRWVVTGVAKTGKKFNKTFDQHRYAKKRYQRLKDYYDAEMAKKDEGADMNGARDYFKQQLTERAPSRILHDLHGVVAKAIRVADKAGRTATGEMQYVIDDISGPLYTIREGLNALSREIGGG